MRCASSSSKRTQFLLHVVLLVSFFFFDDACAFDLLAAAAASQSTTRALLLSGALFLAPPPLPASPAIDMPATSAATSEWHLMNGDVRLPEIIELRQQQQQHRPNPLSIEDPSKTLLLQNPTLIGAGGGGAVFRFDESDFLIKVSWAGSTKSVIRECRTLQRLEEKGVGSAERCLGELPYQYDKEDDEGRIMIVVQPYVPNAVASVDAVDGTTEQRLAVQQIATTTVQMLAANIVTIDVQPLIDQRTGNVIFIDMTEAQELRPPFSFLDQVLMGSFVTEMLTLIPERFVDTASRAMLEEIASLQTKGVTLSDQAKDVLSSQTLFFPE